MHFDKAMSVEWEDMMPVPLFSLTNKPMHYTPLPPTHIFVVWYTKNWPQKNYQNNSQCQRERMAMATTIERRDEKKNPRICYPFPIVLCIGKNEEKRITILLLCTVSLSLSLNILTCCLSHEIFLFSFPHICAYQRSKFNGQMLFIAS